MADGSEKPKIRRIKLKLRYPTEPAPVAAEEEKEPAGYQRLHGKLDLLRQPSSQDEQTARLIKRMKMQAEIGTSHQVGTSSNENLALRNDLQWPPDACEKLYSVKAGSENLCQVETVSKENHDLRDDLRIVTEKSERLASENNSIKAKCEGLEHQVETLSSENHALRNENNSIKEELTRLWALCSRFVIETKDLCDSPHRHPCDNEGCS